MLSFHAAGALHRREITMPLYEYQCQACNHRYERIERVSDPTTGTCPDCGGEARRLLGVPALQFKGSGWYVTDYGKGTGGAAGEKPKSSESKSSESKGSESKGSESKGSESKGAGSSTKSDSSGGSGTSSGSTATKVA